MDTAPPSHHLFLRFVASIDSARDANWAVGSAAQFFCLAVSALSKAAGSESASDTEERLMTTFVFAYRAPKSDRPGTPEGVAAWTAWFESMAGNVVDRGNPVVERSTLGNSGEDTVLGGYSLVTADDLEAAVALAKGCPFVAAGGGVEVGALMEIKGEL
jgi:hypothetical protein